MEMIKKNYGLPPLKTNDINVSNVHNTKNFDEKDLVSAKEARKLSETSLSSETLYELEKVNKCIQDSIKKGYYSCWYYSYLHNQSVRKLKNLGYTVTDYSTQIVGACFKIEW